MRVSAVGICGTDAVEFARGPVAFPLERRHPVTGHVGGQNDWATQPPGVPRRPLLDAGQLRSLAAAGWEIGSHGISHRPLGELDRAAVERELRDSREQLVELTGAPVTSFAFPYGSVPAGAAGLLADAGLRCHVEVERRTVQIGMSQPMPAAPPCAVPV